MVASRIPKIGTRLYDTGQQISVTDSGTVRSTAIAAEEVLLASDVDCYVARGTTPTAAATTGIPLFASQPFHMRIESGDKIAVIRRGSTDGLLNVIPVIAEAG